MTDIGAVDFSISSEAERASLACARSRIRLPHGERRIGAWFERPRSQPNPTTKAEDMARKAKAKKTALPKKKSVPTQKMMSNVGAMPHPQMMQGR